MKSFPRLLVRRLQAGSPHSSKRAPRGSLPRRMLHWLVPRRRLQFGLRAALLLMLAACLAAYLFVRPYQRQREVGRRVTQLGGSVETAPGGPAWFVDWFGEGHLQDVVTIDVADVDDPDEYMDDLFLCPHLEVLAVGGQQFGDDQLRRLVELKKLKGLVLDTTGHTASGLKQLQATLPQLQPRYSWRRAEEALEGVATFKVGTYPPMDHGSYTLSFEITPLPYGGPDWLRARTKDRYFKDLIFVYFNEHATDEHLKWLPRLGGSQAVHLDGSPVTDRGLERLVDWGSHQVTLNYLDHPCRFTTAGLAKLAESQRSYWMIRGVPLGDADLSFLEGQAKLEELGLASTGVSDAQLRHLCSLPLQLLYLDDNPISDRGLKHLPETLQVLALRRTQVTDAGLASLARLRSLRNLRIHGTPVTAAGIERLKQALPRLHVDNENP